MPIPAPVGGPPDDEAERLAEGVTVGVTGRSVRATVTPWGDVTPWPIDRGAGGPAGAPTLTWHIAADDRWHVPAAESTVRQRRIGGAPVVETRVRVPDGDAVQRVWSSADRGGVTVVEVVNESPLPLAIAFAGAPVLTERPPSEVPVQGIDLPADAIVLPVGHRSAVRVGLASDPATGALQAGPLGEVAGADAVGRGWLAVVGRASRLELPDPALVEAVVAARCDLLLEGPVDAEDDPVGFLLDVGELVRLGDDGGAWLPAAVLAIEAVARQPGRPVAAALAAAHRIAHAAGDPVAIADLDRLRRRRADGAPVAAVPFAQLARGSSAGRFAHDVEMLLATGGALVPMGFPTSWLGVDWAVHGVPTGPDSTVSYAVRWHGERPAVLWEQDGVPLTLTAPAIDPSWASDARSGETLWAPPPAGRPLRVTTAR